jgi:hypothetical protein
VPSLSSHLFGFQNDLAPILYVDNIQINDTIRVVKTRQILGNEASQSGFKGSRLPSRGPGRSDRKSVQTNLNIEKGR